MRFLIGITERENLYKVGGSFQRLREAESFLWQGQVDSAKALFEGCKLDQARKFCNYLEHHRQRIVNYAYLQAEGICKGWLWSSGVRHQAD